MYDYEALKALAKQMKRPVTSLIALAPQNDPFYVGTPRDLQWGYWFAGLWQQFGYTSGVHVRRMHYTCVSQNPQVIMPNGKPYENTQECWEALVQASKCARYLEVVDPRAFVDRRNGEPMDHATYDGVDASVPSAIVVGAWYGDDFSLPGFPDPPEYSLLGYHSPQRYHMEIWCEKSTMNDILDRVANRYHAVVQYGMGELSITVALEAIHRFIRSGKPVRIFYVSDFDPAGHCMPVSMARKVEYFIHRLGIDLDVKLFPIVLTPEQVKQYNRLLPTPIKVGERRKAAFEQRYGDGAGGNVAVELDALEALYPGELQRILSRELKRYYDDSLFHRIFTVESAQRRKMEAIHESVIEEFREQITALEEERDAIERLVSERMEEYSQQVKGLWRAIEHRLEENVPELETVPEALQADEREGALYYSARDYLEQNAVYQEYKGKENYEEETAS